MKKRVGSTLSIIAIVIVSVAWFVPVMNYGIATTHIRRDCDKNQTEKGICMSKEFSELSRLMLTLFKLSFPTAVILAIAIVTYTECRTKRENEGKAYNE
ncbi:TPA: hypothetical protein ACFOQZ_001294 [Neisseria meningitidis]